MVTASRTNPVSGAEDVLALATALPYVSQGISSMEGVLDLNDLPNQMNVKQHGVLAL
jgi:hypothetical protein